MADEDFDEAEAAAFRNLKTSLEEFQTDTGKKFQDIMDAISRLSMAQPPPTPPPPSPTTPTQQQSGGESSNPVPPMTDFGAHKVFDETPTLVDDNGIEQIVETSDEQEPSLEPSKSDFSSDLGEKRIAGEMEIPDQLIIEKSEIHQEIVENSKELRIQFESTHMVVEESESATVGLKESKDNSVEDNGESNSEFPNRSLALISYTFESSISASNVLGQVENGMVVERIDLTEDELMIDGLLDPLNEISKMSTDFGIGSVDTFRILGDNGINLVFDPGGIDLGLLSRNEGEGINVSKAQILWNAHEVFEEMSSKEIVLFGSYFELRSIDTREFFEFSALAPNLRGGTVIFKPNTSNRVSNLYPYDRGKVALHYEGCNMFQMEPNLISQGVALLPDIAAAVAKHRVLDRKVVFDPGIASFGSEQSRTKSTLSTHVTWKVPAEYGIEVATNKVLVFDPGGNYPIVMNRNENVCAESCVVESIESYSVLHCIRIFDPSGGCYKSVCAAEMSDFCQVAVQLMVE